MTRDQQADEVMTTLRQCRKEDGQHNLQVVNPFAAPSPRNFIYCTRCGLEQDDL